MLEFIHFSFTITFKAAIINVFNERSSTQWKLSDSEVPLNTADCYSKYWLLAALLLGSLSQLSYHRFWIQKELFLMDKLKKTSAIYQLSISILVVNKAELLGDKEPDISHKSW